MSLLLLAEFIGLSVSSSASLAICTHRVSVARQPFNS